MHAIYIPVHGNSDSFWSDYMAYHLRGVVKDWVNRVESGNISMFHGSDDPITTEHLRIAKRFLEPVVV